MTTATQDANTNGEYIKLTVSKVDDLAMTELFNAVADAMNKIADRYGDKLNTNIDYYCGIHDAEGDNIY